MNHSPPKTPRVSPYAGWYKHRFFGFSQPRQCDGGGIGMIRALNAKTQKNSGGPGFPSPPERMMIEIL
jgi:hypothetical protein